MEPISLGIVGVCGRGGVYVPSAEATPGVQLRAVCDVKSDEVELARERLGAIEAYTNFDEMLAEAKLDAVVIGTPMPWHVPQAIAALEAGVNVLSEVPAGVGIAECRELVLAARRSRALYAMGENYTFTRSNILVRELVQAGLFGTTYYAEGEYIHECRELCEATPWRRRWAVGIDGLTYGTHSLGPVMQWFPGDRVTAVSCSGSGHHYVDPRGDRYEGSDSNIMLCRMASGGLVKIRLDLLSARPHVINCHQLQGTLGCYESPRASGERDRIWLAGAGGDPNTWQDLSEYDSYLPDWYRRNETHAAAAGHAGADLYCLLDFLAAVRGEHAPLAGIDAAMDLTLPGLVSQQSILEEGRWLPVPDSREW